MSPRPCTLQPYDASFTTTYKYQNHPKYSISRSSHFQHFASHTNNTKTKNEIGTCFIVKWQLEIILFVLQICLIIISDRIRHLFDEWIYILFQWDYFLQFIVLALVVCAALAAPAGPDADAQVLRYDNNNIGVDGYSYG